MLIINSPSNDAYFNIASDEYLLNKYPKEDIFLLYVNAPSIIVGKFQNALAEVNLNFVQENGIKVVRRMSGGGAVYHDLGNLNFSFHSAWTGGDFLEFNTFTEPIVKLLNKLDVPARLEGRNDLLVEGKKFSGNAKLVRKGKVIQHGTILIHSDMGVLSDALKINPLKYVDKGIKSNRSRVTNLEVYLPEGATTESFKSLLIKEMLAENKDAKLVEYSSEDLEAIQQLAADKYSTWDWNFGKSPDYNFKQAIKIPAGFIELHLDVEKGFIEKAKVFGDFFAMKPAEEFEQLLIGKKHEKSEIKALLKEIDLEPFFGKVAAEEILPLFN